MEVTAAVVNWNGEQHLAACLDALLAQQPPPAEVLVVDNRSEDRSRELVATRYPQVRWIDTGRNAGPGLARNVAVREARHDPILLLDNDVLLEPGALAALLAARARGGPSVGLVQPQSVLEAQPDVVHYAAADVHFLGLLVLQDFYASRAGAGTVERRAGGAIGLCMLVDRAAYEAAHGAFEELFFFFEDVEFALGLRLLGKEILFAPQAVVRHRGGTAGLSMRGAGARYPARRTFFHSRNRSLLLLTTARWRTLLLTLPSQALYELVQFAFSLAHGHGLAWIRGKLARLPLLPAVLRRRRLRQRTRVVADRDLFVAAPLTLHPGVATRGPAAVLRRLLDRCFAWNWRLVRWACG